MLPKLHFDAATALPNSYFWTWDHTTNWVLDDPGGVNFGCHNEYLKRPETFVEDYRRVTDLAANLGVRGIVIYGFLRDSRGGVDFAKRVADYAAQRGVGIMPGVGTTWYGGIYYEGDHRFNIDRFAERNPGSRMIQQDGTPMPEGLCPSHPAFVEWLQAGMRWIFDEFNIGGVNIENGDLMICHCPRCNALRKDWPQDDPAFFRSQAMSYLPAINALDSRTLKEKLVAYATYKGFVPGRSTNEAEIVSGAWMECDRPAMLDRLPSDAVAQWTITSMVGPRPVPLAAYLDDGAPDAAFGFSDSTCWPKVKAPGTRNVGYLHHGSVWGGKAYPHRYDQTISGIKQACLCAFRSGMEGVGIFSEVTDRHIPWALNYLAFGHFIHRPEDSLREFGRKTLSQVLGGEDEGERFVETLAAWEANTLTAAQKESIATSASQLQLEARRGGFETLRRHHFWSWLDRMIKGKTEPHTISFF